jgi:N-acetylglucosamine-6-phosphate deacetylase
LSRPILAVTLAPELPGGEDFVRAMSQAGKLVAIGHSAADGATVTRAAAAGARLSTHLGNGLPQTLPKLDNPIFAQLAEDRLFASFIADFIHLPQPALRVMLRAKTVERSILVTDAVSAAAAPAGPHPFAGMVVEHAPDGSVRLPGRRDLAGSALTLDRAVRNLVTAGLATVDDALRMAGANPRDVLAPTLARYGIALPAGAVDWSDDMRVLGARIGAVERQFTITRRPP